MERDSKGAEEREEGVPPPVQCYFEQCLTPTHSTACIWDRRRLL